jgi:hypothetical protein
MLDNYGEPEMPNLSVYRPEEDVNKLSAETDGQNLKEIIKSAGSEKRGQWTDKIKSWIANKEIRGVKLGEVKNSAVGKVDLAIGTGVMAEKVYEIKKQELIDCYDKETAKLEAKVGEVKSDFDNQISRLNNEAALLGLRIAKKLSFIKPEEFESIKEERSKKFGIFNGINLLFKTSQGGRDEAEKMRQPNQNIQRMQAAAKGFGLYGQA